MLVLVGEPQGFSKFATPNGHSALERTSYKHILAKVCICGWTVHTRTIVIVWPFKVATVVDCVKDTLQFLSFLEPKILLRL